MRFLVDECLSPRLAKLLSEAGHDTTHVIDVGLSGCPDIEVLAAAAKDNRVLLSADTDFGEIIATTKALSPSVVLIRRSNRRPEAVAGVVLANLGQIGDELENGAFVVLTEDRIRLRVLPLADQPSSSPSTDR